MNQPIEAVTFDAGGTLIHLRKPVGESYSKVAGEFDIHADPGALQVAFREVWKTTPSPFSNGKDDREKRWWKHVVKAVFSRATSKTDFTSPENFDAFFGRLFNHFAEPGIWELDPDALPVLETLSSRGIRAGIISNFDKRLFQILSDLDVLDRFDPIVISDQIRTSKPSRMIFDHAISHLSLPAHQILHVGDDPVRDLKGAEAAGMRAFLVGRKGGRLIQTIEKLPLAQA